MYTAVFSVMHFLVDGVCAFAIFFGAPDMAVSHLGLLIYNLCAFALQFPIGAFLDYRLLKSGDSVKGTQWAAYWAVAGFVLTSLGALLLLCNGVSVRPGDDITGVIILGLGNALFHVGGGVGTIREDIQRDKRGSLLGIFVAPGAVGLFLGRLLSGRTVEMILSPANRITALDLGMMFTLVMAAEVVVLAILLSILKYSSVPSKGEHDAPVTADVSASGVIRMPDINDLFIILPCFIVVILRSYAGLSIGFDWKTGTVTGLAAVLALALGKVAGGISGSRLGIMFGNRYRHCDVYYGYRIVTIASLFIAAVSFVFSNNIFAGIVAIFAFNMTMPITLYVLCSVYRHHAGSMFGLLTLALFLGYLPVWAGAGELLSGGVLGAVTSVVSLAALLVAFTYLWKERDRVSRM